MKFLKTLLPAVAAGIAISIGGCILLSVESKVAGALLFSVGLYTICAHGLNLYTGKVGYLPEKTKAEFLPYVGTLGTIWLGNLLGCILSALLVRGTRIQAICEKAESMAGTKLADSPLSLLFLGFFCGFLMYAAVEGYRKTKNPLILFAGVAGFILPGFEHCVADMFYFAAAGSFTLKTLGFLLVITIGNSLGGMLVPCIRRLAPPEETKTNV